ncbi:MAG: hypothetical protein LH624_02890, partial [Cryobacterium sp.]|nr:hypothetical protein [Cryobacterium sp.]
MSHTEAAAGMQAAVTKLRLSPVLVKDHCVATVPGAIAPAPMIKADRRAAICPGPEALGINGLPDSLAQTVSVSAASAPAAALPSGFPAAQGAGSLTISGLPWGGNWAGPVMVRGQVTLGQISAPRSALIMGAGGGGPG